MVRDPSKECKWSDTDLATAVTASRSWRGVMRELGLCVTSAGSLRVVKRRVALLGLDTSHFTGQRPWSDAALKRVAAQAHTRSPVPTRRGHLPCRILVLAARAQRGTAGGTCGLRPAGNDAGRHKASPGQDDDTV